MEVKLDDCPGVDEDAFLAKQRSEIDRFIRAHEHMFEEWDDSDLNYPRPGEKFSI